MVRSLVIISYNTLHEVKLSLLKGKTNPPQITPRKKTNYSCCMKRGEREGKREERKERGEEGRREREKEGKEQLDEGRGGGRDEGLLTIL